MKYTLNIGHKLDSEDKQFIIVANNKVFLRIALNKKNNFYDLMTATASDSNFKSLTPNERNNVVKAAHNLLEKMLIKSNIQYDHKNREYVYLSREINNEDELNKVVQLFFQEYQLISNTTDIQQINLEKSAKEEMQEIYHDLSVIDGQPVYLSDGMYLHPDGEIKPYQ